jgi:hypothetical protein
MYCWTAVLLCVKQGALFPVVWASPAISKYGVPTLRRPRAALHVCDRLTPRWKRPLGDSSGFGRWSRVLPAFTNGASPAARLVWTSLPVKTFGDASRSVTDY